MTSLSMAASAAEMTPPTCLRDRVRPLAYRRAQDTLRCLTFHCLFPEEREHAVRLFRALKREGDLISTAELLTLLEPPWTQCASKS